MIDIKRMLPELRALVQMLAEDLLQQAAEKPAVDEFLQRGYTQFKENGRISQSFEEWREDYLDQVAVAWVLACVFVRFMEDNGLIDECWLAGVGERRRLAEDTHELFFRQHPHDTDREYLQRVFREVGQIPAAKDLFAEGKTPLWAVAPSGDAAMGLLKFWRERDAESGRLKRSFLAEGGDARFLGDLYQELSERAKKKYALLQTPVFVEEFILDRALTPALAEFGLETVRMIDPTCGSGHFLLGGFARLFDLWSRRESNEIKAAQKALDGVWGVDINPFAVAIARFRLIVAAAQACGIKRLKQAPGWNIHLASGDSLLFGGRPSLGGGRVGISRQMDLFEVPAIYAVEDRETLQEILGQGYHVVVGNPPYIIVRDRAQNAVYRQLYSTCHQKYSLGVPFTQRFWELAIQRGEDNGGSGYIGMITANSFMKREFGKKLVEEFFPKRDLTHVIDTSGAYIPGHGTPTVILFGRAQKPVGDTVRAVLGIKGEPSTPDDPARGLVWRSIVKHIDQANAQDEFTSTADAPRETFANHPWSIGGGGAADLTELIEGNCGQVLSELVDSVGITSFTLEDDVYILPWEVAARKAITTAFLREMVVGDALRDWHGSRCEPAIFPYDSESFQPVKEDPSLSLFRYLWNYRVNLSSSKMFGGKTKVQTGLRWYEYGRLTHNKLRTPLSIAFAFVASHNHFVLDRGGKVFNRSAPIIKLPAGATEDDHLALLGLLNSSTACFWMKQVSQQKQMTGGDGVRVSTRAAVPYEFAGTQLQKLPLPASFASGGLREKLLTAAKRMDELARKSGEKTAAKAIEVGLSAGADQIAAKYGQFLKERAETRAEMVYLQEEIDFINYAMYGLTDESLLSGNWRWPSVALDVGQRPFEILQQRNIDGFAVPADVPSAWPDEMRQLWRNRIDAIRKSNELRLIEDDHYKRRWRGRQGLFNHTENQDEFKTAARNWLLDRLETYWKAEIGRMKDERKTGVSSAFRLPPLALHSTAQMADVASADAEFLHVATLYRGRPDFDVAALVAELVEAEAVPLLPILRYKPSGLRKRAVWERTWELQRRKDEGERMSQKDGVQPSALSLQPSEDIPVPPKYTSADFLKTDYWRLRGKLDVPKERWVSYPHGSTDSDRTLVVGWAGWNHLEQATALIAWYDARKREGWDAQRLAPLLAGLDQLLPWIHQWHPEIDPEFGETAGQSYQAMLEHDAHELGLTLEEIRKWEPRKNTERTRKKRKNKGLE